MKIKNLSTTELKPFGEILTYSPVITEFFSKNQMNLQRTPEIKLYEADSPVVIDYVSGMSLLILYQGEAFSVFYLDRAVSLHEGARFSLLPMGESSCIQIHSTADEAFRIVGEIPLPVLDKKERSLEFQRIYTFLYQESAHNFYFRGEKHLPYELVYVDRGKLHTLVRGQDILLEQQDLMIIDSNDWHMQYSDVPVSFLTVSFWAGDGIISTIANKSFALSSRLKPIVKKLLSGQAEEGYTEDYRSALLQILLIELLQNPAPEQPHNMVAATYENEIVDGAVRMIADNIQRKLSLDEVAAAVHISVPYLYKLFQTHLCTSPGKYIAKIRTEECKVLLREGKFSVGQVAKMMDFSSIQQFSRQFHSVSGMTPTEYIRSLR